ncbi:hypothetical protein EYF80_047636 [Liparis tanakae]|uniref:Uncharacterized protein n=1 Tax=Liparis tanakae TaxID=230148 RepID=A0A4Z2FMY0_9TELE|nr:hypothetical protein EYF80_047636 [Liparis tanakae]
MARGKIPDYPGEINKLSSLRLERLQQMWPDHKHLLPRVALHLYSADQTNRFNSPKLAALIAALMCSWAASQRNMLPQTHAARTGYPRAGLEMQFKL